MLHPPIGVGDFLTCGRRPGARAVVVCAGDSITQGVLVASYVRHLDRLLGPEGYQVVNAGIASETSYHLLRRLDGIIACDPDLVTVLIGTNDVHPTLTAAEHEAAVHRGRLPQPLSIDWFGDNLAEILRRLTAETRARVAVLEIPMIGEDLESPANAAVRAHNRRLREVAERAGVEVLPLFDRLVEVLPEGHQPPPYADRSPLVVLSALLRRGLLRQHPDDIARRNGLVVLTDHIHLSDRGARVVADLVVRWVQSAS